MTKAGGEAKGSGGNYPTARRRAADAGMAQVEKLIAFTNAKIERGVRA